MNLDNNLKCILCGFSGGHIPVVPVVLYGSYPQQIFQCPSCRLAFAHPAPLREEFFEIYSKAYFQSDSRYTGFVDYSKSRSRQYGEGRIFTKKLKKLRHSGKMLEVGCATGFFLEGVYSVGGWEAHGVELSEWAATEANKKPGLKVTAGTLEEAEFPVDSFDVVVIRDLLEHVTNPVIFLERCHEVLKPGGRIFIKVPNGRCNLQPCIDANRKYGEPVNITQAHLFYFEPENLRTLMKRCGFRIIDFYAVGLKRGLRALGYIPKIKRKDSTRLHATEKPVQYSTAKKNSTNAKNIRAKTARKTSILIAFKSSDVYYRYKYFVKHSIRIPLSIGHNYILWAEKV